MIAIEKALYWELRTRISEHQARVKEGEAVLAALFQQAGLAPGRDYRLDDATCAAVEVPLMDAGTHP